ncbi:MAG: hypothetical protein CMM69_02490 [Rhodospirillaceae bacterium]|nr:hypothetical protein [Rhodospirillaceae bacterium]
MTHYDDVRPSLNDPRLSADWISPYLDRLSEDDPQRAAPLLHLECREPRTAPIRRSGPTEFRPGEQPPHRVWICIHFCVGAPLARMEGRFALAVMIKRMAKIELGDNPPVWRASLVLRDCRLCRSALRLLDPR